MDAPPNGIAICQVGGVVNAKRGKVASMAQVVIIGIVPKVRLSFRVRLVERDAHAIQVEYLKDMGAHVASQY